MSEFIFYIIGLMSGICLSLLVVSTLTYFRRTIEHITTTVENKMENVGPRPKGHIWIPPDEADEVREGIIEENNKKGVDTPIEELR